MRLRFCLLLLGLVVDVSAIPRRPYSTRDQTEALRHPPADYRPIVLLSLHGHRGSVASFRSIPNIRRSLKALQDNHDDPGSCPGYRIVHSASNHGPHD